MKRNLQRITSILDVVIPLFFFNSLFWVCNIYPRHILEFDSFHSILAILLNLIFYGVFVFFLIYQKEKNNGMGLSFELRIMFQAKPLIKKVFLLLLLQLFLDLLNLLFSKYLAEYFFILSNLLTFAFWIITYMILKNRETKVHRRQIILFAIAFLGLGICLFFDFKAMAEQQNMLRKITEDQVGWMQVFDNIKFEHSNRNFFLDIILGSIFLIDCALEKPCFDNFHILKWIVQSTSRVLLLLLVFCLSAFIEKLISPNATLVKTSNFSSVSKRYIEENDFFVDFKMSRYHRLNEARQYKCCYRKTIYEILYGNKYSLETIVKYPIIELESNEEDRPLKNKSFSYEIGDTEVIVYDNWAICYAMNGQPSAILFDEINEQSKNEILIETCKKMIEDGNIIAFEYAGEYLNRYDPTFVFDYASRYANADFNYTEKQYIADYEYRDEYLVSLGRKWLNKTVYDSVS